MGIFPLILRNFKESFFYRTPPVASSGLYDYLSKLLLRRFSVILFTLTHSSKRLREATVRRFFSKKVFSNIFADFTGTTCVRVSLLKRDPNTGFFF